MASMAKSGTLHTLDLSSKLFKNRFAFGIDFGSSIIKVAYTTDEGDYIRVHIVNFPRKPHSEALQFLKNITEGKLEPGGTYHTAGVGVGEFLEEVERTLNIKCSILSEHDCMKDAFKFLAKHQSWEDFVCPVNQDARRIGALNSKTLVDACNQMYHEDDWENFGYMDEENKAIQNIKAVQYPIIFSLVGSGHYLYKIDKKAKLLDFYTVGGRTILGLGALLLGAKSFSDVIELAVNGDANKIDQSLANTGASDTDDVYSALNACDAKLFSFGLAAKDKNEDELSHKKEDIAAALKSMISNTVAQDAFNWSMAEKVHQVFFLGGVVANDEGIRREIEKEFMMKSYGNAQNHVCDCFFVKAGGHLSAIGALLSNLEIL